MPKLIKIIKNIRNLDFSRFAINPSKYKKLAADVGESDDLAGALVGNSDLAKAWEAIDDEFGQTAETIRRSPEALETIEAATDEGLDPLNPLETALRATGKEKPTWDETKAPFKRGNDFNRKPENYFGTIIMKFISAMESALIPMTQSREK